MSFNIEEIKSQFKLMRSFVISKTKNNLRWDFWFNLILLLLSIIYHLFAPIQQNALLVFTASHFFAKLIYYLFSVFRLSWIWNRKLKKFVGNFSEIESKGWRKKCEFILQNLDKSRIFNTFHVFGLFGKYLKGFYNKSMDLLTIEVSRNFSQIYEMCNIYLKKEPYVISLLGGMVKSNEHRWHPCLVFWHAK